MEKPNLKKSVIRDFCVLATTEALESNSIILVTSAGTITGKVAMTLNEEDLTTDNMLLKFSQKFASTYRQENEINEDESLPGNDGFVCLDDVRIISGNNTINFPSLIVFYDQIIAITVGRIE